MARYLLRIVSALFVLFPFLHPQAKENLPMNSPTVILETTHGKIELTLNPEVAPKACENFLGLVEKQYYDGVLFHRVIKDFMLQTGDPLGNGTGGQSVWGKNFEDEVSPKAKFDKPGLLAMANRGPNTNGSQFFITTVSTPWLNMRHTIFGSVSSGYEVVKKIESVQTNAQDKPLEAVKILKAYVKE